jgi:hypothetical protein
MPAIPLFFLNRWPTYAWANYGPRYAPALFTAFQVQQITQTTAQVAIIAGPSGRWRAVYGRLSGKYDMASTWVTATGGVGSAVTLSDLHPNTPYFVNIYFDGQLANPAGLPITGGYYTDEQSFTTLGPSLPEEPPEETEQAPVEEPVA